MASLDFPSNPTNGQTYALNGVTYYYNSTMGAWLTQLTSMNLSTSSNTQVLFNDAGIANGSPGFVFNKTTGNFGVGTSSPSQKLHVLNTSGDVVSLITGGTGYAGYCVVNGNGRSGLTGALRMLSYSSGVAEITNDSNAGLLFGTNSAERMRIDSSGSLLIGAASAPGTGLLQVVRNANDGLTRSLVSNSNSGSDAISYMLFGNDTASGGAAGLRMGSSTSSSLVPGNGLSMFNNIGALTFSVSGTERMRITSGGSLGLGTSSPSYLLHVANGNMAITSSTGAGTFQITDDSDSGRGVLLKSNHSGTANTYIGTNSSVKNLIFGIDQIERMRLDTSGNLGINTNGSTSKVAIRKDDQSGYTTSALELQSSVGNVLLGFHSFGSVSPVLRCERGFTGLDSVNGNQSAFAPFRASAFTVNSDYREKENIVPLQNALSRVANLKPSRFNYIESSMSYFDGRTVDGFIAHELHEVIPEAVIGEKDAVSDEGKPLFQSVDLAKVVPLLTAAIQELKVEFDAYKAAHP